MLARHLLSSIIKVQWLLHLNDGSAFHIQESIWKCHTHSPNNAWMRFSFRGILCLGPTCPLQHRAKENIASQPTFWKLLNLNQKHEVSESELLWTHCIKSDIYTMREMCNSIWVKYNSQRRSMNRSHMKFHKLVYPHIQIATSKIFKLTLKAVLKLTVVLITGSGHKPQKGYAFTFTSTALVILIVSNEVRVVACL